jgi:hypothetical protein
MLTIRMSRLEHLRGFPGTWVFYALASPLSNTVKVRLGTTTVSAFIPIVDNSAIGGFPAGQEPAARAAACRTSGGMPVRT